MPDGRSVQLGGEVIGEFHWAYRELVAELDLTLEPAFPGLPGSETHRLDDRTLVVDDFGWMSSNEREDYLRVEALFSHLSKTVDPDDPWSHPDADKLDSISVSAWMRSVGAVPATLRAREMAMRALAAESPERTSLLADLRKEAAAGSVGFYSYDAWESHRVAEGSARVALLMAQSLDSKIRYSTPVRSIHVDPHGSHVVSHQGERFDVDAVVSAVPVGPLRDIQFSGVSTARLESLSNQRHALAAKVVFAYDEPFWETNGQNGSAYSADGLMGGTWSQRHGVLSALVPPERIGPFAATAGSQLQHELISEMVDLFGRQALTPDRVFVRNWFSDPYTQGYITAWRPGDVMRVGPLHGTHEPPFYVCGSDQWVCGYMEGAIRTGRGAASAILGSR